MSNLPDIEKIIERQVRSWELRRRSEDASSFPALDEGPWISVSKQFGSGGISFAHRLAAELGWQVFDKQILAAIAENTDWRDVILSRFDQQARGSVNDYVSQLVIPDDPGRLAFVAEMVRVIWGLARQGNAIILGRGANWFLESRFGLRLRVVAPLEHRAGVVSTELGLPRDRAERRVRADDATQAAFIRQIFDRDVGDPQGYDLVINLGAVSTDQAVPIAVSAMQAKLARTSRRVQ